MSSKAHEVLIGLHFVRTNDPTSENKRSSNRISHIYQNRRRTNVHPAEFRIFIQIGRGQTFIQRNFAYLSKSAPVSWQRWTNSFVKSRLINCTCIYQGTRCLDIWTIEHLSNVDSLFQEISQIMGLTKRTWSQLLRTKELQLHKLISMGESTFQNTP